MNLTFTDQDVRLRLCPGYVIIDEHKRFDQNGVSTILRNDSELNNEPSYELMLFDTDFEALRLRFDGKQAELDRVDQAIIVTEVIRSNPMNSEA